MSTGNWFELGDITFRKVSLYDDMGWEDVQLRQCREVIGSSLGGSILLIPEDSAQCPDGYIFSGSGHIISCALQVRGITDVLICITPSDLIVTVSYLGLINVHDLKGNNLYSRSVYLDEKEKVTAARNHLESVALMTNQGRFILMSDIRSSRPLVLTSPPSRYSSLEPTAWAIVPVSMDSMDPKAPHRLLVAYETDLFLLTGDYHASLPIIWHEDSKKDITGISVSFTGQRVCLKGDMSTFLLGFLIDEQFDPIYEYDSHSHRKSREEMSFCWAGEEAISVLYRGDHGDRGDSWSVSLFGVNKQQKHIKLPPDAHCVLIPEPDGVRIISQYGHDLVQQLPTVVNDVVRLSSESSGTHLNLAYTLLRQGDPRADVYLDLLTGMREEGVWMCIQCAINQFDHQSQQDMMAAAAFGRLYCPQVHRDLYLESFHLIRTLNHIKAAGRMGMSMSPKQMDLLGGASLINRLLARELYKEASKVADALDIDPEEGSLAICRQWALDKVRNVSPNQEGPCAVMIREVMGADPVVSYADIAYQARSMGQTVLATRLLEYEARASLQVPLLIQLGEHKLAIAKAIESGDPHLIHSVKYKLNPSTYRMSTDDPMSLVDSDDFTGDIMKAIDVEDPKDRVTCLVRLEVRSKRTLGQEWLSLMANQHVKLAQSASMSKGTSSKGATVTSSDDPWTIHHTIQSMIQCNNLTEADKLRTQLKVSDKRYCYLKVMVWTSTSNFASLDKLVNNKPPIGIEAIIDILFEAGHVTRAQQYLPKLDASVRCECAFRIGCLEDAAKFALENRDEEAYESVLRNANQMTRNRIENMRRQKGI